MSNSTITDNNNIEFINSEQEQAKEICNIMLDRDLSYLTDGDYCDWQNSMKYECDNLNDALNYLEDLTNENGFHNWIKNEIYDGNYFDSFEEFQEYYDDCNITEDFFNKYCDYKNLYKHKIDKMSIEDSWQEKVDLYNTMFNTMYNLANDTNLSIDETNHIIDDDYKNRLSEFHLEKYVEFCYKTGEDISLYDFLDKYLYEKENEKMENELDCINIREQHFDISLNLEGNVSINALENALKQILDDKLECIDYNFDITEKNTKTISKNNIIKE